MRTIDVLGTPLAVTTYDGLGGYLADRSAGGPPHAVDFSNTQIVTMRRHVPRFRELTSCMDQFVPDGMPLIWAMNRQGAGLDDRVYGPTFTRRFLSDPSWNHLTHYLVGGSPECGDAFRRRLRAANPGIQFVGGFHGLCDQGGILDRDEEVLRDIRERRPDFIWVGLGTPKQYAWIARVKERLERGILLAVGFAFDVNAGTKPDAPDWMQRHGLTWVHRMASEPKRLAGRYLKWNSLYLWYLFVQRGDKGTR